MLEESEQKFRHKIQEFVNENITREAEQFEKNECIPECLIQKIALEGYLGCNIPKEYGGSQMNCIQIGILNSEFAKGCFSVRSLLTVQGMVAFAILRWGTDEQKSKWLPKLASGEAIGGFALAEKESGTDAKAIRLSYKETTDGYILSGEKRWVTYGKIANLLLVFARDGESYSAFLVEKEHADIEVSKVKDVMALNATMIADIKFKECNIPKENLIGGINNGIRYVASTCLDYGRITVAWGCLGISQACLEICCNYMQERKQFGQYLKDISLVQKMLTEILTKTTSIELLCEHASRLRDKEAFESTLYTCIAKYEASNVAVQVTNKAIQILGAAGCTKDFPIERYYKEAKICELIEGTSQIMEILISSNSIWRI